MTTRNTQQTEVYVLGGVGTREYTAAYCPLKTEAFPQGIFLSPSFTSAEAANAHAQAVEAYMQEYIHLEIARMVALAKRGAGES